MDIFKDQLSLLLLMVNSNVSMYPNFIQPVSTDGHVNYLQLYLRHTLL